MTNIDNDDLEPKIIKTQDENGQEHSFELLDIVNFEDQDYGLLIHLNDEESESEEDEEEEEVVIMKINKDENDAYSFEVIENEDEFNKVVEYLEESGHLEFDEEDEDSEEE